LNAYKSVELLMQFPVKSSQTELLSTFEKIRDLPVLVVGDVMLDRYVWGVVDRISPEAPVPVVLVKRMEDRLGGAGNVVRNLRALGAQVELCGFIGDDEQGQAVLKLLSDEQVGREGVIVDSLIPTTAKTRVIAHNQQVVRIDREEVNNHSLELRKAFDALVDSKIDSHKVIIISDYGKGTITESLLKRFADARNQGRIGDKCPLMLDPHPRNYNLYSGMTAVKPNRKEAEEAAGIKIRNRADALMAAPLVLSKWKSDILVLSLAEDGMLVATTDGKEPILIDTVARKVADVSGAGDAVTAVFAAALGVGASLRVAGDLANISAGIVVGEVGTVPVNYNALREEIMNLPVGDDE
jgi:D-beta-D-heptose 7-phosphate kinase / D-beta-D-heptose 1-phosphate adenosyltransferase